MSTIFDFQFRAMTVQNPDGTLKTTLPSGCSTVQESFGTVVKMGSGNTSAIKVDIANRSIAEAPGLFFTALFAVDTNFTGEQYLLSCGSRLAFTIKLVGDGKSVVLAAETVDKENELHAVGPFSRLAIPVGQFVAVDVIYYLNTLCMSTLTTVGSASTYQAKCHGFGPNSAIKVSGPVTPPSYLQIAGRDTTSHLFVGKMVKMRLRFATPTAADLVGISQQMKTPHWYITTRSEMEHRDIGSAVAPEALNISTGNDRWTQEHERGVVIYHPGATSAYEVYGVILRRFRQIADNLVHADGIMAQYMGLLTSGEIPADGSGGRMNTFQRGAILWTQATGAYEVYGLPWDEYNRTGGLSRWGYPLEPRTKVQPPGLSGGYRQKFQNCHWYIRDIPPNTFSALGPGFEVHGQILWKFLQAGGLDRWGLPTTHELDADGPKDENGVPRTVKYSAFDRCRIYWSPSTGPQVLEGDILNKWLELGGPRSPLGMPTGDALAVEAVAGEKAQPFENGVICVYGAGKETLRVVYPFYFIMDGIRTENVDYNLLNPWDETDTWFTIRVRQGGRVVLDWRMPDNNTRDYANSTWYPVFRQVPVRLVPHLGEQITMEAHVYDNENASYRELGAWTLTFDAANAWGFKDSPDIGAWGWGPQGSVNTFYGQIQQDVPVVR
ncbi:hypothetical protein B0H67DRAFT_586856 [Lasiosphaeris hirsuta]|uniref:Uncharacterized protein n=1 Tax=Lasiosphaeris hirsuta TaxID=260670 RepID=A0AA40DSQ7_9PEZI|nr:hypothetical protein B0H67DRAFT_586856 [Lasiosphaeris hirsuta]